MAKEEKDSKAKFNIMRTLAAIALILVSFFLLTNVLKKIKEDRIAYKKKLNPHYEEQEYIEYEVQDNQQINPYNEKRRKKGPEIGDIDIPNLFGTELPKVEKEEIRQLPNTQQEINTGQEKNNKNTKENTIKEKGNYYDKITPDKSENLSEMREDSKKNMNKYIKEFDGNKKKAKKLYVLNLLRKLTLPILVSLIIVSYVYQYIFGLKTKKIWKQGRKIRIISVALLVITQTLPFIYALIVKGWGN